MFWRKNFPMYPYGSDEINSISHFYSNIPGPRKTKMIPATFMVSGEELPVIWFKKPVCTNEGYVVACHAESDGEVLFVGNNEGKVFWGDALSSDYTLIGSKLSEVFDNVCF